MAELMIEYEPRLVEEAVLSALRRADDSVFRAECDALYEIDDPETRDAEFRAFHGRWFERLGLDQPILQALQERPSLSARVARFLLVYAPSGRDEEAELFLSPDPQEGSGTVVLRLRPETITLPGSLCSLLRHELTHIADMLDPDFGYEPRLRVSTTGPVHEGLLRDRYRVLWDTFIDGRLVRLDWASAEVRNERLLGFARAFPMLGAQTQEVFERFFSAGSLTHRELVAFAADPRGALRPEPGGRHLGERCSLCGFLTHAFEPEPERLAPEVVRRIRQSLPGWNPAAGLCQQCADLYRSQRSLRSAGALHAAGSRGNEGE